MSMTLMSKSSFSAGSAALVGDLVSSGRSILFLVSLSVLKVYLHTIPSHQTSGLCKQDVTRADSSHHGMEESTW